jgi:hypothetical protein
MSHHDFKLRRKGLRVSLLFFPVLIHSFKVSLRDSLTLSWSFLATVRVSSSPESSLYSSRLRLHGSIVSLNNCRVTLHDLGWAYVRQGDLRGSMWASFNFEHSWWYIPYVVWTTSNISIKSVKVKVNMMIVKKKIIYLSFTDINQDLELLKLFFFSQYSAWKTWDWFLVFCMLKLWRQSSGGWSVPAIFNQGQNNSLSLRCCT